MVGGITTSYNGVTTTYAQNGTTVVATHIAGELIPGAGSVIGSGIGSFVGTMVGGGDWKQATANGAYSAAGALNDVNNGIHSAVNWVGDLFGG